jgi:hypothetical protein
VTRYKALTRFQEHEPGDTFDADLDPGLERRAKARGQIRVIKRDTDNHEPEETADAEADSTQ